MPKKKAAAKTTAKTPEKIDKNGWSETLHYRLRTDDKEKRCYFEIVTKAGHVLMTSKPYVYSVQARRGAVSIVENIKRNAPPITPDTDSIPDYVGRSVEKKPAKNKPTKKKKVVKK